MMPEEPTLTAPQFRAAQLLIARMIAEIYDGEFNFESVGVTWTGAEDQACAITDDGVILRVGDVMYAAIVLLWSTLLERADAGHLEVQQVIAKLGAGLAMHDPSMRGR